jgi:hypothetical protein
VSNTAWVNLKEKRPHKARLCDFLYEPDLNSEYTWDHEIWIRTNAVLAEVTFDLKPGAEDRIWWRFATEFPPELAKILGITKEE